MDPELQALAEQRLDAHLRETGAEDPRPRCRELLRELRTLREEAYADALREYAEEVTAQVAAEGGDPLAPWLAFTARVAARLHPGRTVRIDGEGRAEDFSPPARSDDLLLHLPDAKGLRALLVGSPREMRPAQAATVELLVHGKVRGGGG